MPTLDTKKSEPIRIPLVGTFNQRLFTVAATGDSGIVGTGIIGQMVIGSVTLSVKDQRFINAIPDVVSNPLTNTQKLYCYKRPGMQSHSTPAAGSVGSALKVWTGQGTGAKVISAFGSTNSTVYDGTSSLGALSGVATDITETIIGTTANLVIPTDANKAYFYPDGGAMTQITDVDFPGNVAGQTITGTFVHMNGYSFIMTTSGRIYNSDLNSISAWTSTSFLSANMYPDQGVGCARYKDLVVGFGKETIQFFRDVGNATGSPLQNVPEAFIKIGAVGPNSITSFEDNLAWVAASDTGSISVYMLDGYKPVRISDNVIDGQLSFNGGNPIYLTSVKLLGKTLIFLIFGTNTFVYCIEDKIWHEWRSNTVLWHKWAASTASSPLLYAISRASTAGMVFRVNPISPQYLDNDMVYSMTIQTSKVDFNTERRKFLSKLTLVADSTTTSTLLEVSWSDDDYNTFTTPRTINMSSDRKYLSNCGPFRRRAFKLENESSSPIRLEALEFEITEAMH